MLVRRADKAACRSLGPLGPEDACNSQCVPNSLLNSMRHIQARIFWVYELISLGFSATHTLTRLLSKSAWSPACSTYPSKVGDNWSWKIKITHVTFVTLHQIVHCVGQCVGLSPSEAIGDLFAHYVRMASYNSNFQHIYIHSTAVARLLSSTSKSDLAQGAGLNNLSPFIQDLWLIYSDIDFHNWLQIMQEIQK